MTSKHFQEQKQFQLSLFKKKLTQNNIFTCNPFIFNLSNYINSGNIITYQQVNFEGKNIFFHENIGLIIKIKNKNNLLRISVIPLNTKSIDVMKHIYLTSPTIQKCKNLGKILKRKSKLYYLYSKLKNLHFKKQFFNN